MSTDTKAAEAEEKARKVGYDLVHSGCSIQAVLRGMADALIAEADEQSHLNSAGRSKIAFVKEQALRNNARRLEDCAYLLTAYFLTTDPKR